MKPLISAVKTGDFQKVKALLDAGANPNEYNEHDSHSPLSFAVFIRRHDIAQLLLERGANVNQGLRVGHPPLVQAAGIGDIKMVRILLDSGANINSATDYGITPLITAVYGRHSEIARLLLGLGANTHLTDEKNKTALDWAKEIGDNNLVELLEHIA